MKDPRPKLRSMLAKAADSLASDLDLYTRKRKAVESLGIYATDEPDEVTRKLALAIVELQAEVAQLRKEKQGNQ